MTRRTTTAVAASCLLGALVVGGSADASVTGRVHRVGDVQLHSLVSVSDDSRFVVAATSPGGEGLQLVERASNTVTELNIAPEASRAVAENGGATVLVSTTAALSPADNDSGASDVYRLTVASGAAQLLTGNLSDQAGYEAWDSSSSGQVLALTSVGRNDGRSAVLRLDLPSGSTTELSSAQVGQGGDNTASRPTISDDGRFVSFVSSDAAFVWDATTGSARRLDTVSDRPAGATALDAWVAGNGGWAAFTLLQQVSDTTTLVSLYRRDLGSGSTELVATGVDGSDQLVRHPLSADGARLVYVDSASGQVMLFDSAVDSIEQVSSAPFGVGADGESAQAAIVPDGSEALFASDATNLVEEPVGAGGVFGRTVSPELAPASGIPRYQPVRPQRVLDTRVGGQTVDGIARGTGRQAAGERFVLDLAGRADIPAGVTAVALNVTVTAPDANGYLTVWPCTGDGPPNASNVNFSAGQTVANLVLAPLSPTGSVCLVSPVASTELIADVNGYFPIGSELVSTAPQRIFDTRTGGRTVDGLFQATGLLGAGQRFELPVAGRGGVAPDASAVALNVTATGATGSGYLTVWPCDTIPNASSLNFAANADVANLVIVPVSASGTVCLQLSLAGAHLVADLAGWFPGTASYVPLSPARVLDSRPGGRTADGVSSNVSAALAGAVIELQVAGRAGVPNHAAAVALNVTSTGGSGSGFVSVWPCEQPGSAPNVSSVNFARRDVANLVIVALTSRGTVCLQSRDGTTQVVADIAGYVAG